MPRVTLSTYRAAAFVAATLLAACSAPGAALNASVSAIAQTRTADSSPAAKTGSGSLYVISPTGNSPGGYMDVFRGSPLHFVRTVRQGLVDPTAITFNSRRQIYVANEFAGVTVYRPGDLKPIRQLTKYLKMTRALAVTKANDLYVIGRRGLVIFPNSQQRKVVLTRQGGTSLAADSSNNVYVAAGNLIDVYPQGAKAPSRQITDGVESAGRMITDASGNLYVANDPPSGCGTVTVYNATAGTLEYTISNGICTPTGMSLDSSGNIFVCNYAAASSGGQTVTGYAAGTNTLVETISKGVINPLFVTVDPAGNAYVANRLTDSSGDVTVYPSGQTMPSQTLTKNIVVPQGMIWLP